MSVEKYEDGFHPLPRLGVIDNVDDRFVLHLYHATVANRLRRLPTMACFDNRSTVCFPTVTTVAMPAHG